MNCHEEGSLSRHIKIFTACFNRFSDNTFEGSVYFQLPCDMQTTKLISSGRSFGSSSSNFQDLILLVVVGGPLLLPSAICIIVFHDI